MVVGLHVHRRTKRNVCYIDVLEPLIAKLHQSVEKVSSFNRTTLHVIKITANALIKVLNEINTDNNKEQNGSKLRAFVSRLKEDWSKMAPNICNKLFDSLPNV